MLTLAIITDKHKAICDCAYMLHWFILIKMECFFFLIELTCIAFT